MNSSAVFEGVKIIPTQNMNIAKNLTLHEEHSSSPLFWRKKRQLSLLWVRIWGRKLGKIFKRKVICQKELLMLNFLPRKILDKSVIKGKEISFIISSQICLVMRFVTPKLSNIVAGGNDTGVM